MSREPVALNLRPSSCGSIAGSTVSMCPSSNRCSWPTDGPRAMSTGCGLPFASGSSTISTPSPPLKIDRHQVRHLADAGGACRSPTRSRRDRGGAPRSLLRCLPTLPIRPRSWGLQRGRSLSFSARFRDHFRPEKSAKIAAGRAGSHSLSSWQIERPPGGRERLCKHALFIVEQGRASSLTLGCGGTASPGDCT